MSVVREFIEFLELDVESEEFAGINPDEEVPHKVVRAWNLAKTSPEKSRVFMRYIRMRQELAVLDAANEEKRRKVMGEMDASKYYKQKLELEVKRSRDLDEDRMRKKINEWALETFVVPDTKAYLSGKLRQWIKQFKLYVSEDGMDVPAAVKALKLKAGEYLKKQMLTLNADVPPEGVVWSTPEDRLEYILITLQTKAIEQSDPGVAVRCGSVDLFGGNPTKKNCVLPFLGSSFRPYNS